MHNLALCRVEWWKENMLGNENTDTAVMNFASKKDELRIANLQNILNILHMVTFAQEVYHAQRKFC